VGVVAGTAVVEVVVVVVDVEVVVEVSGGLDGTSLAAAFGGALSPHALIRTRQVRAATAQGRRGRTGRA
jgi:hypothetical protein